VAKIIIIEDTETIRQELATFLNRYGYEVIAPTNFENIISIIEKEEPNLILLDINLPVFDGFYICREVRKTSQVPIIVVTSSVLKRVNQGNEGNQEILVYNDLKLNLSNGTINCGDNALEITKNELKVLYYLIKNKGNIVSREDLMDYLWKSNLFVDDNTLSVNVTRLRKKLEEIGIKDVIETRRGLGYIMP